MTRHPQPIHDTDIDWIPLREGLSFRPLHFEQDGYSLQLRLEPGTLISHHRHTGEVHAFNLCGERELIEDGVIAGPGAYVYEPAGNVDSWRAIGSTPCIVQISLKGRVEYLDDGGEVIDYSDTNTARKRYLEWCAEKGREPDSRLVLTTEMEFR